MSPFILAPLSQALKVQTDLLSQLSQPGLGKSANALWSAKTALETLLETVAMFQGMQSDCDAILAQSKNVLAEISPRNETEMAS